MNIFESIIIPTITGVLGGVGGFLFQRLYETRMSGEGGADYRQYSGIWRGMHVTADPKTGKPAYSDHVYRLSVDKRGRIKGELSDLIGDPPWEFAVSGQIYPGAIIMTHRNKQRPEIFVVEMYKTGLNPKRMVGMITTSTYDKDVHFAGPIVLSRDKTSDDQFRSLMKATTTAFYGELDQVLGLPEKATAQQGAAADAAEPRR
jgi:hypothetical protein